MLFIPTYDLEYQRIVSNQVSWECSENFNLDWWTFCNILDPPPPPQLSFSLCAFAMYMYYGANLPCSHDIFDNLLSKWSHSPYTILLHYPTGLLEISPLFLCMYFINFHLFILIDFDFDFLHFLSLQILPFL